MNKTFQQLGIPAVLEEALGKQQIFMPTDIQEKMIPEMMAGGDVIARSETGSGKTLAYLLPIYANLDGSLRGTQAIILTPTHELASQVYKQAELLAESAGMANVGCALIIGSANIARQMDRLKTKPQIVVGSTGRILDLIQRRKIQAHLVKTIVLDEGDRLLEDGHIADVEAVIKTTLKDRQIVLLSASVDEETRRRAKRIMRDPSMAHAGQGALVPKGISHYYVLTTQREKFVELRKILAGERPVRAMVFINNPENIEVTVDKLCHHGIQADGIYGKSGKLERKNALDAFRSGKINVLVASDIGARGLDIPDVTHIINMDVPEEATFYLHRAGRSGRKGQSGVAITLVTPYERRWIHKYEKAWGLQFVQKEMSYGELIDSKKTKKDLDVAPRERKADRTNGAEEVKVVSAVKKTAKAKSLPKNEVQEEPMGFLAKKAKLKAQKEENRRKTPKK